MPIPFLIAGAAVGVAAAVLSSDKKKEPEAKTTRRQISASDVPDDIRRQIEAGSIPEYGSPQDYYQWDNEYYYGWNGRAVDHRKAKECFQRARNAGHEGAKRQIYSLVFQY